MGTEEIQYGGSPTFNDGGNITSVRAPASCDDTESYIELTRKEEKFIVKPEARLRIWIRRSVVSRLRKLIFFVSNCGRKVKRKGYKC